MLKFGLKIVVLVALVLVGVGIISVLTFDRQLGKFSYLSALIDKHHRLESVEAPRIIFIGGSGLAFGMDSPQVEQALHIPVVNMGVHASLGLRFMLNEVQSEIAPGDIVVLTPEYEQFYGYLEGKETLLDELFVYPQGLRYLSSSQQIISLVEGLPVSVQNLVRARLDRLAFGNRPAAEDKVYRRGGFNAQGDVTSHLDEPSKDVTKLASGLAKLLDENSLSVLSEFTQQARRKGARVFFLFPAIPRSRYPKIQDQLPELCEKLQSEQGLTLLAAPRDYVFSDNSFYDTVYHLNRMGRDKRTKMVISDLKQGLEAPPEVNCRTANR